MTKQGNTQDVPKAPMLTDEEIDNVIGTITTERYLARHATNSEARMIAEAQRDADHDYYLKEIARLKALIPDREAVYSKVIKIIGDQPTAALIADSILQSDKDKEEG